CNRAVAPDAILVRREQYRTVIGRAESHSPKSSRRINHYVRRCRNSSVRGGHRGLINGACSYRLSFIEEQNRLRRVGSSRAGKVECDLERVACTLIEGAVIIVIVAGEVDVSSKCGHSQQ